MMEEEKQREVKFLAGKLKTTPETLLTLESSLLDEVLQHSGCVYQVVMLVKIPLHDFISLDKTRRTAIYACNMDSFFRSLSAEDIRTTLLTLDVSILQNSHLISKFILWSKHYKLPLKPLFSLQPTECMEWLEDLPENVQKLIEIGVSFEVLLSQEYEARKNILYSAFGIHALVEAGLTLEEIFTLEPNLRSELTEGSGDNIRRAVTLGLPVKTLMVLDPLLRRILFNVYLIDENFRTAVANTKVSLAELLTAESAPADKKLLGLLWTLSEHSEKARDLVREFIRLKRWAQHLALHCLEEHSIFSHIPFANVVDIAHHSADRTLIPEKEALQITKNAMLDIINVTERPLKQ